VQCGAFWRQIDRFPVFHLHEQKHLYNASRMDIILVWDQLETERLCFSFWFATDAHKVAK